MKMLEHSGVPGVPRSQMFLTAKDDRQGVYVSVLVSVCQNFSQTKMLPVIEFITCCNTSNLISSHHH